MLIIGCLVNFQSDENYELKIEDFNLQKKLIDLLAKPDRESENIHEEFFALNEAYKRLIYESKHGSSSFDELDPKNDPRTRDYWEIRRRRQTPAEIKFEEDMNNKARERERTLLRRSAIALLLGVFFGTIFPALFIGGNDYQNDFSSGCQCEECLLKKVRQNPTLSHLTRKKEAPSP